MKQTVLATAVTLFALGLWGMPQIRPMTMTVNRTNGAIVTFTLTFSEAAGETTLFACWGASDAGAATNGWDHVQKIADIAATATSHTVPITAFPKWGDTSCRAIRFVMEPGKLFDRATKYLQTTDLSQQFIDTGYHLTAQDTSEVAWSFTHNSSQGNTLVMGTPAFKTDGNGQGGYIIAYVGGNTVTAYASDTNLGVNDRNGTYQAYFNKGVYFANQTEVVKARLSATERVIWTNGVDSAGDFIEVARNAVAYEGSREVSTNCFLFGWPGQVVNGKIRYTPFSNDNRLTGRMYYFEISRGGEVAANGIPCVKDGEACFYDSARRIFLRDGQKTSAFLTNSPEVDAGVYTELVSYAPSAAPEGEGETEITLPRSTTARVSGLVRAVGTGASTVDVRFAYAPVGESLPALAVKTNGLAAGETFSFELADLTPGATYQYAIDFVNDQGIASPLPATGTFVAQAYNSWIGTDGAWSAPANWNLGRIPEAGDNVSIGEAATVFLDAPTPSLNELEIAGTLTVSNWTTKITAQTVQIAGGGVLTCSGGATNQVDMSRVWIACGDLTVAKGGRIDVAAKGFQPYPSTTIPNNGDSIAGYGPGALYPRRGAAHGGIGSTVRLYNQPCRVLPYGDAENPEDVGSSGSGSKWGLGAAGGGAVWIDATGTVTVNGTICADAADMASAGTYASCGSGGSIRIGCTTFHGDSGTLSANGGSANVALQMAYNSAGFPGGGGRIAIHYDSSVQTKSMTSGMTFSVAEGYAKKAARNAQDACFGDADAGTLWFSDDKLLGALGSGIWGRLVNTGSEVALDSLTLTWGRVRFVEPGIRVTVSGDVAISGETARLEFGGDTPTNRVFDCDLMTTVPWTFTVNGNLTVSSGARLDFRAACTNGTTDVSGGQVAVDGKMKIGTNGVLYCWSDVINGGSPHLAVGDFEVEEGGLVSADRRGFAGGTAGSYVVSHTSGYGPSAACNPGWYSQGAGYGGAGGLEGRLDDASHDYGSHTYGDAFVPTLAGSGGAATGWGLEASGGGLVFVTAINSVVVNGTVSADGWAAQDVRGGAGSGGAIYLRGKTFSGGATALLSAKGGDAKDSSDRSGQSGAGGGGRIAVWTGEEWNGRLNSPRISWSSEPSGLDPSISYLGSVAVNGGQSAASVAKGKDGTLKDVSCAGEAGTVRFCHVSSRRGVILIVK